VGRDGACAGGRCYVGPALLHHRSGAQRRSRPPPVPPACLESRRTWSRQRPPRPIHAARLSVCLAAHVCISMCLCVNICVRVPSARAPASVRLLPTLTHTHTHVRVQGCVLQVLPAHPDQRLKRDVVDAHLRSLLVPRAVIAWSARTEISTALLRMEAEAVCIHACVCVCACVCE
jgi:hypothetical protein